jgi:hypothetical protein
METTNGRDAGNLRRKTVDQPNEPLKPGTIRHVPADRTIVYHDPALPELIRAAVKILDAKRVSQPVVASATPASDLLAGAATDFLLAQFGTYKRLYEEGERIRELCERQNSQPR